MLNLTLLFVRLETVALTKKMGERTGSGKAEDVEVLLGHDKDG